MEKIKGNILKALLAFFGMNLFTSCYGMPPRDYEISGYVVDEDNNAVPGILVAAKDRFYEEPAGEEQEDANSNVYEHGAVLTDRYGRFSLEYCDYGPLDLEVKDIDGPANGGEFESQTVSFDYKDLTQTNAWYDDTYHVHDAKIVLKKKQ